MSLFGKKELQAQLDELKQANIKLYELGIQQAQEMKSEVERLMGEISQLKADQTALTLQYHAEQEKYHEKVNQSEAKLKEVQSESELLLLQLHQVQEELESVFLKEQEAQNKILDLNQSIALLTQDKSTHEDLKAKFEQEKTALNETIATLLRDKGQLGEEKTKLTDERNALQNTAKEQENKIQTLSMLVDGKLKNVEIENEGIKKEVDELKALNQTLVDEKNKTAQEKINLLEATQQLKEEKNTLIKERDLQSQLALERQTKIDGMSKLIDGQLKEVQEENELLLLQLHQVQEELEHHFLEHQKLQRENDTLLSRWQRLEQREPQYLDYESILPILVDTVSEKPRLDWRAHDLTVNGEIVPEFLFTTFLEDGMPGIEMTTTGADKDADPVRLVPRALIKPNAAKALSQFRQMAMKDWQALAAAIKSIEQFFKAPKKVSQNKKLPDFFDVVFWRQALSPLVADFKSLPAVFRFDRVTLKREQINPDYEHLWFEFHHAAYGAYQWPALEMRFAAANVQPGGFSRRPKIELPKINNTTAPFDSWFKESEDDFGEKMELRFDLNKQFFDLEIWSRITPEDRAMLISLIGSIPFALKSIEEAAVRISRPYDDWNGLAIGLIDILRRIITEAEKIAKEAKDMEETKRLALTEKAKVSESEEEPPLIDVPPTEVVLDPTPTTSSAASESKKRFKKRK